MPLGPMDVSHNDGVLQPPTSGIFHPVLQCGVKQQLLGEGGEPEGRVADVGVVWLSKLSSRDVRRRFCGDVCERQSKEKGVSVFSELSCHHVTHAVAELKFQAMPTQFQAIPLGILIHHHLLELVQLQECRKRWQTGQHGVESRL